MLYEVITSDQIISAEAERPKIGIIKDSAFQFYYPENLDALAAAGAETVFISPLAVITSYSIHYTKLYENASQIYIASSVAVLVVVALLVFFIARSKKEDAFTPVTTLAFGFILMGMLFGSNRVFNCSMMRNNFV